jgi:hypothetical protein
MMSKGDCRATVMRPRVEETDSKPDDPLNPVSPPITNIKTRMSRASSGEAVRSRPGLVIRGPGQHRGKTMGGSMQRIGPKPSIDTIPKAPYVSPDVSRDFTFIHNAPLPHQKPLNQKAKDLLEEFVQRQAFWDAIHGEGAFPPLFAGRALLHVQERQVRNVLDQLHAMSENRGAANPRRWFRAQAMALIAQNKITDGAHTASCSLADRFFEILGRTGPRYETLLTRNFGGRSKATLEELEEGASGPEREYIRYLAFRHISKPAVSGRKAG